MSGNSCASALQTAPIVSDLGRVPGSGERGGQLGFELLGVVAAGLGCHQRAWKVSLYLPICNSSPSSSRCESIRERFT